METKTKTVWTIILTIVLVAVLGAGIFFVARYTNNFTEGFKTLYVEKDGKVLSNEDLTLYSGAEHKFKITALENINFKEKEPIYNVRVVTNSRQGFQYKAGERDLTTYGGVDVTKGFDLTKEKTGFTISIPEEITIQSIFEKVHDGDTVVLPDLVQNKNYFILQVTSKDNKTIYNEFYLSILQLTTKVEISSNLVI